jgi:hypothetical protein
VTCDFASVVILNFGSDNEMNALSRRRGTSSSKEMLEKRKTPYEKKHHKRFIDSASTTKVLLLIATTFLVLAYRQQLMPGAGIQPDVSPRDYEHEGYALQGFLALPDGSAHAQSPAVIIVP